MSVTAPAGPSRVEPDWDRLVSGVLLVGLGVVWLLSTADVIDPNWRVLLPVTLIGVGALMVLLAVAGRGASVLIGTGTLLTVLVVIAAIIPANPSFRVGEQTIQPVTVEEVQARYSHGMGTLTIDLRDLQFEPGFDLDLEASNGIGDLVVRVPEEAALDVSARVGVGSASAAGRSSDGFGARLEVRVPADGPSIRLDLSVGIGEIRVVQP